MAVLVSSEIDEPVSPSSSMGHSSAAPAFFQAAFNGFTVLSANEKNTEELRLLEPGPAHEYLNALFDKLKPDLIRRCGADFVNSFEIHVTDHPWLTCHLDQDSKNIIVIDTTLLSKIKSEDALVSILGHEIGHAVYRLENNIPEHFKATIEEECFCDIFGMQLTQSLGLNPRGAEELFIVLSQERQSQFTQNSNDFLRDLMRRSGDEHLTPEARVKNIQTAIGAIRLSTGDEDLGSNTSTKDLQYDNQGFLSSDQAKHVSHIDKWKAKQQYENKTLIEKLILLNSLSGEVTNEARRYEFLSLASKVRFLDEQPSTPRELKTLMRECDKLFVTVLGLVRDEKDIKILDYAESLKNFWRIDANLLGVTRELNANIKSLNASLNQSELVQNSKKLYELIEKNRFIYNCYKSSLEKILLVYRDISDYDYDAVTKKLLKKATADKSLSLAKLLLLDTDNFRYPISINWDQFLDKFTLSQAKEIFQSNRHLINERFLEKFQYYLDLRERNESIDIDEDLFWQNPTDFLHRYKDLLISPYSRKSDSDITQSPYYGLKNEDAFEKHLKFSNNLRSIFERAIQQNDEEKIQTIVNLFVGEDDKIGLIPSILFEVSSPANYSHEAVWSDFVYQNKKIFALDQRINVLRQLHVVLPENDNWLFSYLDSGGVNNLGELRILLAQTAYLDRYLDNAHGQYNKFLIKQLNRILENDIDSEDKIFDLIKFHC